MKIITSKIKIEIYNGVYLKIGEPYILSDPVFQRLLELYPGELEEEQDFDIFYNHFSPEKAQEGCSILMFRSGGIGDIFFMLPLAKYLFKKYKAKITFGTSPQYTSILENLPFISTIIKMPFRLEELLINNWHLMFEQTIETGKDLAEKLSSIDLFFNHAGIDYAKIPNKDKIPEIILLEKEKSYFSNLNSIKEDSVKIGIQIEASSPVRSYPPAKIVNLIGLLLEKKYSVFLFGGNRQIDLANGIVSFFGKNKNIHDFTSGYSIRSSMALASFMDVIIAPDSAFVHIAGSLGIPLVGLYGPFPSSLRLRHYDKAVGLDASLPCSPCMKHGKNPCVFGPSSACLELISPELILQAIEHLLQKKPFTRSQCLLFKNGEHIRGEE